MWLPVDSWSRIIQNLLFPPTCLLCGDRGLEQLDICPACLAALPWLTPACPVCGLPQSAATTSPCGACQRRPPPFDRLRAALRYEEPVRHLIQGLKFRNQLAHARLLGELLALRLGELAEPPERLIPVPLHRSRFIRRGFNQAEEIARIVSARSGIPLDTRCARRVRATDPQAQLRAGERRRNIRQAFRLAAPLSCRHVAIVDDVVTTGATVGEFARALRQAGVSRIEVWSCARALPPG